MVEEVTKATLIEIIETDDSVRFMGKFTVGTEERSFYKCTYRVGNAPKPFKIVYIVT